MIWKMRCGVDPRAMTVVTPAAVANSAAINLVIIPPVPSDDPAVATETRVVKKETHRKAVSARAGFHNAKKHDPLLQSFG